MNNYSVSSLFDLTGKTAIVTGASKGIGKEIALLLANNGVDVALIARNRTELNKVAKEIESLGRKALVISHDLNEVESIPIVVQKVYKTYGKIDILINNAGINIPKSVEETSIEDWDKIINLNLKSVFFLTQAVGKIMRRQDTGKIINVSSQMAFIGYSNRSAYAVSKGGITQLTKSLAIEWAPHNINVNAIAPTFTETIMTKELFKDDNFKNEVISQIPLGRLGKPDDLFGAFIYLASEAADMVTGQTILIDGGWTVR